MLENKRTLIVLILDLEPKKAILKLEEKHHFLLFVYFIQTAVLL